MKSLVACLALSLTLLAAHAEPTLARILPSHESGWPQFRGPARNGICEETGLLKSWPEGGPPLVWERENIGRGYSSPIITGDTLYITGDVEDDLVIFAFNLDGTLKWKTVNGRSWDKPVPGARASCTYDDGLLFHMNSNGRVACFDPADGRELWVVNILERFGAENIHWGMSECLLLDGDKVIVTPGGPEAFMAALDKKTGKTIWKTIPLRFQRAEKIGGKPLDIAPYKDCDRAGYTSPILFEFGSRRLIAGCSGRYLFLVDADDPRFLWTYPVVPARWEVIGTMPVLWRDRIVFSAPDFGTRCFQMEAGPETVTLKEIWEADIDDCHGGLVEVGGRLYGSGYRRSRDWVCIDLETGGTLYTHPDFVKGAVLFADGRIYALAENGTIELLKPGPGSFETVGRFDLPKGSSGKKRQRDVWAHPVIHRGKLYLRNHDILLCYDIRETS